MEDCVDRRASYILGDPEASDWAEKHKRFLAPIRSQNDGDRLELVW